MVGRSFGIILVGLGLLFLAVQGGIVSIGIDRLWPLFILVPGLLFEVGYLASSNRSRNAGLLVPGGILTVIGLLFLFEASTGWRFAEYTWPIYPGAVAFGLLQLYIGMQPREKALLIPVGILGAVTVISFAAMLFGQLLSLVLSGPILGVLLIALGAYILYRRK